MGLASSFLLQLNLSLLINHGSIVIVLWPFRLETVRIGGVKILVLQSLSPKRAKRTFIKRKCANFLGSPTDKSFWPLAKNISSNFCKSPFPLMVLLLILQLKRPIPSAFYFPLTQP